MVKSAESYFYEFRTNSDADTSMSLIRSKQALLHVALMAAHLGDGQIVDGMTLGALIEEDLVGLPAGTDVEADDGRADDASVRILKLWREKRWVRTSVDLETRIERYQLTSGAVQAVRQMRGLRQHTSIATESALAMVMAEMRQIATAANPDPDVHKKALDEQISLLVEQRERLEAGETPDVNMGELVDKVAALAQLIDRIPTDLARYGEQMHANTAALIRMSLTDDPAEFAQTLQRMFEGHDVIAASPEGQAFRAFANLIGNPAQRAQLENDITAVLSLIDDLPDHLAESLTGFIETMWQRMREVEGTRKGAFRRMNHFVRGGDALHHRSMRTRIAEAQVAAGRAFEVTSGGRDTGFAVPMGPITTRSIARIRLDEGTGAAPDPVVDTSDEFTIDAAELAGRETIDWPALREAIHVAMDAHGGYATLPEVMEQLIEPRTGDVIAIWALATRHGDVDDQASETVYAHTRRGPREIKVPYLVFADRIPDPIPATKHRPRQPELVHAALDPTLDLESTR